MGELSPRGAGRAQAPTQLSLRPTQAGRPAETPASPSPTPPHLCWAGLGQPSSLTLCVSPHRSPLSARLGPPLPLPTGPLSPWLPLQVSAGSVPLRPPPACPQRASALPVQGTLHSRGSECPSHSPAPSLSPRHLEHSSRKVPTDPAQPGVAAELRWGGGGTRTANASPSSQTYLLHVCFPVETVGPRTFRSCVGNPLEALTGPLGEPGSHREPRASGKATQTVCVPVGPARLGPPAPPQAGPSRAG